MSYNRNTKWLDDKRIIYRRDPISDIPTIETSKYKYYEQGTYECYHLFTSKALITTYKSLKWHFLVIYYLNYEHCISDEEFDEVARFIADKENGFVTFFIKNSLLTKMIKDVINLGGDPPQNRIRKVIFKYGNSLTTSQKLSIVGKLIGKSKISKANIYDAMLVINDARDAITIKKLANYLSCTERTIYRHMCKDLKTEKQILNEELQHTELHKV
jgi:hypothetical protein